ncbi:MOB kinase activator 3B [Emys orbicularis]|uniref:MOB kinase activator 3B n=1 Tax=Emys orbicularis TaxID=82168 RepID=UPI0031FC8620
MSIALKQVFNKDKTFRPKRRFEPGTQRFELHKRAQASLNSGVDLKAAVQLPNGEDLNDWVAVHVVDFFNRINLIYGTICEFCTERTCPMMSGGPKYEYRWQDDLKYKKPTALPAPQYMNLLMDWIEVQINNEDIFPTSVGVPFPKNFLQICKKILCRLFRVFVHVYIHHFDRIIIMGAEAHVNTCYKHFYYFVTELNVIDRKELEPLKYPPYPLAQKNLKPRSVDTVSQEDMSTIIARRRWRWIGHVLQMEIDSITRVAIRWTPEGKRKRGHLKTAWQRAVEAELKNQGHSWGTIERLARNRQEWRNFIAALAATGVMGT